MNRRRRRRHAERHKRVKGQIPNVKICVANDDDKKRVKFTMKTSRRSQKTFRNDQKVRQNHFQLEVKRKKNDDDEKR